MAEHVQKNEGPGRPVKALEEADKQKGTGDHDTCRCKETSKMTPRQLVGLMVSDLAFWKKAKKG